MKFKRFLSLFFVVLLAVCIPCAFLAGCNGNSDDDGTDGNTSNNDSNGDKTYTGDAIFTEGMTLAQLRAATENIDNFTMEFECEYFIAVPSYKVNTICKFDGTDASTEYYDNDGNAGGVFEFSQNGYRFIYEYNTKKGDDGIETEAWISKSLLTNTDLFTYLESNLLWDELSLFFNDGEVGIELDIASTDNQVISSYLHLEGSFLELGFYLPDGAWSPEEDEEKYDYKFYGVNATVVDTGKIQSELADAEWADYVSYNGYSYRKAVDKDGNEYYYIESSHNSEAEPEKTINTLPVKPRES